MKTITIYSDGSAIGNPGPGGWGAVIFAPQKNGAAHVEEIGGHETHTTNNRMELSAALEALTRIPDGSKVTLKTDSSYVINGVTKWVFGWEKNGWQTKEKKEVLNRDLWESLTAASRMHKVTWEHVRAHVGIDMNERADMIANGFARKEKVQLFAGTEVAYKEYLKGMPKARATSSSSSKGKKAYSYVSLVDGKIETHTAWAECEARVKGKKAKFKKVFSADEEKALTAEWRA